jgi:hypothetical protein
MSEELEQQPKRFQTQATANVVKVLKDARRIEKIFVREMPKMIFPSNFCYVSFQLF